MLQTQKHIPWKVRREQRGGEGNGGYTGWSAAGGRSGARPGYGGGAREKGGNYILEVRQGYNTSPYVRRRHSTWPKSTPSSNQSHTNSLLPLHPSPTRSPHPSSPVPSLDSIITDATRVQYSSCPEVNPRNTVHPLTSSPLNPINKNNSHLPLTRTFPPIP